MFNTLTNYKLQQPMYGFGAAIYNDTLFTFHGQDTSLNYITQGYSAPFMNVTTTIEGRVQSQLPPTWTNLNHTLTFPTFNGHPNPDKMYFSDQRQVQVSTNATNNSNNIVYIAHASLGSSSGLSGQTLIKFNADTQQYDETSTYSSISGYLSNRPCVVMNNNFHVLYIIGGFGSSGGDLLDLVFVYHIASDTWAQNTMGSTSMNDRRFDAGCAMYSTFNYVYLVGGYNTNSGGRQNSIIRYDVYINFSAAWSMTLLTDVIKTASEASNCMILTDLGNHNTNIVSKVNILQVSIRLYRRYLCFHFNIPM